MKKITSDLIGLELNFAVALALGYTDVQLTGYAIEGEEEECFFRPAKIDVYGNEVCGSGGRWSPSTKWNQGGPITIAQNINTLRNAYQEKGREWCAHTGPIIAVMDPEPMYQYSVKNLVFGPTPLVAAMRCIVVQKFGQTIDIEKLMFEYTQFA